MRKRGRVIKRCGMKMILCEDVDIWRLGKLNGRAWVLQAVEWLLMHFVKAWCKSCLKDVAWRNATCLDMVQI